eukprot:s753_g15.t1
MGLELLTTVGNLGNDVSSSVLHCWLVVHRCGKRQVFTSGGCGSRPMIAQVDLLAVDALLPIDLAISG